MEHLHTNWDSWHLRHWVGKWLHRKVERLRPGESEVADWEQSPPGSPASETVLDAAAASTDEVHGAAEHKTAGAGLPQAGSDPVVDAPFEADMWYDEAPAFLRQWQGGVVDLHIINTLAVPVEVIPDSSLNSSIFVGGLWARPRCARDLLGTRCDAVFIEAPSAMPLANFRLVFTGVAAAERRNRCEAGGSCYAGTDDWAAFYEPRARAVAGVRPGHAC